MNKVRARCSNPSCAKFSYASKRMFKELKIIKFFLYLLNAVPVIICFLPTTSNTVKIVITLISFGLTLINEVSSQLVTGYKEKAIILQQLYESEITGSTFSKIEYDRETTNEMQELAIRKGNPGLYKDQSKSKSLPVTDVPEEISDDYSYLYIARQTAAKIRFLLSREFILYVVLLVAIGVGIICYTTFNKDALFNNGADSFPFYYFICFWPVIIPLIRNALSCKKAEKQCVKISADIDNFFADGDDSIERLARFYFYVQNIEFEMLVIKPIIFYTLEILHTHPLKVLSSGVTVRFKDAINELKSKKYISQPKGKSLITKVDYDLETLKEKDKLAKLKKKEEMAKKNEPIVTNKNNKKVDDKKHKGKKEVVEIKKNSKDKKKK